MSGGVKEASAQYKISRHSREEPVPSEGGDRNPVEVGACPAGYKQTEVGVIPDDWELTKIDDVVKRGWIDKPLDGNHGDIHPKSGDFVNSGIPFVMANNLKNGKVDITNCSFIKKEQADSLQKGFSNTGDVLLTHKATIGNTAVVGGLPCEYIMLTPQVTYYRVLNNDVLNNHYLRHYMDGNVFQAILETNSGGGTRSYIGITAQRQLPIVIPLIKEQTAIANALSDVDALITSLEKLITKKRAIKTAAMQQLLTGKKRLPPFDKTHTGYKQTELGEIPEDWGVEEFGFLFESSVSRKSVKANDEVVFIGMQDVSEDAKIKNHHLLKYSKVKSGFTYFEKNDVLVAKITPCFENGKGCITNKIPSSIGFGSTEFHVLRAKVNSNSNYIFHFTSTSRFRTELTAEMVGSAGHRRVPLAAVQKYLVAITYDKQEQTAIANALSDMDKEIEALQQRLTKTQQLKQGMMQELLTGKTRLV